ncbi:MAG: 50S ribosomal protein L29 [Candidatus Bathyarchaeota archaeon]|nr:50S ribosomal protein L29 [Candidatus Bathyarchaeum tardum]WGM89170.1 MAG: 50S ribosomal protein L29 [Candidatus Bathyarchaeum tardum]WNZ28590.1 MAG: 50S ribosomal protein L29 [Candidatus Bathyarchaeota archaeon]
MPILRVKEMRELSSEKRLEKVNELRTELARLKTMVAAGGAIDNPSQIRALRKTIARLLTIETEEQGRNEQ